MSKLSIAMKALQEYGEQEDKHRKAMQRRLAAANAEDVEMLKHKIVSQGHVIDKQNKALKFKDNKIRELQGKLNDIRDAIKGLRV